VTDPPGTTNGRQFDQYVLDDNTLDELASLICGDDGPRYREGRHLDRLLENAGWRDFERCEGRPRWKWLVEQLRTHNQQPGAIASLVRRLADSREYLDDGDEAGRQTLDELNTLLAHDGFQARSVGGRGEVVDITHANGPEHQAPIQLNTTVAELVANPAAAQALQRRLDEAVACQGGGAHLAAVVMMGSLLEGVLVEVLAQRGAPAPNGARTPLEQLIIRAHDRGFIQAHVRDFSHALKNFRNLVHVHRQIATNKAPNLDTTRICWDVLVAALNDLALTAPPPAGS
jgi:hypothetical protein